MSSFLIAGASFTFGDDETGIAARKQARDTRGLQQKSQPQAGEAVTVPGKDGKPKSGGIGGMSDQGAGSQSDQAGSVGVGELFQLDRSDPGYPIPDEPLRAFSGSNLLGAGTDATAHILFDVFSPPDEKSGGGDPPLLPGAGMMRVSASEKGSVLVYPKVELRWTGNGALLQDAFITLNNDYTDSVHITAFFVTEDGSVFHSDFDMTANESAYWMASTGLPKGVGPFNTLVSPYPDPEGSTDNVVRGFVVVIATNFDGEQIRWNHLYGGVTTVHYGYNDMWEYNAYAYKALDPAVNGEVVGTPGDIQLDGVHYDLNYDCLIMDFFAANDLSDPDFASAIGGTDNTIDTDLTLVIADMDLRQGGDVYTTKVDCWLWNQNEAGRRTHICVTLWNESLFSQLGGSFTIQHLQTDRGRARLYGIGNVECEFSTPRPLLGVAALYAGTTEFDGSDESDNP